MNKATGISLAILGVMALSATSIGVYRGVVGVPAAGGVVGAKNGKTVSHPVSAPIPSMIFDGGDAAPRIGASRVRPATFPLRSRVHRATVINTNLNGTWKNVGPILIKNYYQSGSVSGRVNGLAISPRGVVYAASDGGGVWTSSKTGKWSLLPGQPSYSDAAIAMDPKNPDVLYVATGPEWGPGLQSIGILESQNGGTTWSVIGGSEFYNQTLYQMTVDPANSSELLVAGSQGLAISTDSGATWSTVISHEVRDFTIDPANPSTIYAGVTGQGVEVSTDGGQTWALMSKGLPVGSSASIGTVTVAAAPSNPTMLYALFSVASTGDLYGIYASNNGGQTWTKSPHVPSFTDGYDLSTAATLTVSPKNPDIVYVGSYFLIVSHNAGKTWTRLSPRQPLHVDIRGSAWAPNGDLYLGTDGGVYVVTPSGKIEDINGTLPVTQIYSVQFNPGTNNNLIIGTQDNGIDAGWGSKWRNLVTGDVGSVGAFAKGNFIFNDDAGLLWAQVGKKNKTIWGNLTPSGYSDFDSPVLVIPGTKVVLLGGLGTPYFDRSTNGGKTFTPTSVPLPTNTFVDALADAPGNPDVVYAGLTDGTVYMSKDAGATWTELAPFDWQATSSQDSFITSIAVSPTNPAQIVVSTAQENFPYLADSPNVFETTDTTGSTAQWTNITGDLPAGGVRSLLYDGSTLLAGTDSGLYLTADEGQSWTAANGFPSNVPVMSLAISENGTLAAGTYGRGVWILPPHP